MELILQRDDLTDTRTIGMMRVGALLLFTLEDPVREGPKVPGSTAIPAGRYQVVVTPSRRFRRMLPLLLDVPGFEAVRIHPGNTAEDTQGCILVGLSRAHDSILSSRLAMGALQPLIAGAIARGGDCWITVRNPLC